MSDIPMTPAERREFLAFTRSYVRSIKTRGEAHAAQLALACEEELSAVYARNEAAWAEAVSEAEKAIEEAEQKANEQVAAVFAQRGLDPSNYRRMPRFITRTA